MGVVLLFWFFGWWGFFLEIVITSLLYFLLLFNTFNSTAVFQCVTCAGNTQMTFLVMFCHALFLPDI